MLGIILVSDWGGFFFKYRQVVKSCLAVWKLVTKSYYQGIRKEEGEQDKGIFQS